MSIDEFTSTLNEWGSQRIPFLFLVDFEMKKPLAFRLSEIDPAKLMYNFNGVTNVPAKEVNKRDLAFQKFPLSLDEFRNKFSEVVRHLEYGDSYLTNLTVRTALDINLPLRELFHISQARYKLLMDNSFLVFSPEIFVQIRNGSIFSYPMKGTIDAAIPQAREKILHDVKELAEHVTIVDLIRNDLSRVAGNVRVTRFRYIDELRTNGKVLLQVSSEITGEMEHSYLDQLGTLIVNLLPAGSVSGAPKARTVEIIRHAEGEDRGYYTGVAGIFDGQNFDSGVMIRFIEQQGNNMYYRSGGGITTQSELEKEYQEVIDKIYVPLD
ncbi:aminodeoxychorismate synthase component I [Fulvivirgaceae bacterium PWU4]|uniref:Aminodeoxychorismate synthase component I n=1 Tax=Chryseosolibacter histidini TaxID=2782349 RepID=A0AAP2DP55_9BACT|nr:aminodeoxychorismate synthase component I [Chryseosolibacter histidini]MBT1699935.1 aminodeoxychorismate synthase component I [Chryseosolibacter histidini]